MAYHIAFKVQPVNEDDEDHAYNECILASTLSWPDDDEVEWIESRADLHFNLDQAIAALHELSEDDLLADMIRMDHELRLWTIELFMRENFSHSVLCDSTNTMARYNVRDANIHIDRVYELIEMNFLDLMLLDYDVFADKAYATKEHESYSTTDDLRRGLA